jgi:hypothetical protein
MISRNFAARRPKGEGEAPMDNTITSRADVVAVQTQPRPTATPVRVQFADVLSGGAQALVRGAQAAVSVLPGAPLAAVAVRGGSLGFPTSATPGLAGLGSGRSVASAVTVGTPEGPGGATGATSLANVAGMSTGVGGATAGGTADGGLESTMAQSEQMNLYYLQVQEEVNAQNRTYTALSNVLEVEHSTAKSAIGNIH